MKKSFLHNSILSISLTLLFSLSCIKTYQSDTELPDTHSYHKQIEELQAFFKDELDGVYSISYEDSLLHQGYQNHSIDSLDNFFKQWHQLIQPISPEELSSCSDTIRLVYSTFTKFYHIQEEYLSSDYIVINNKMHVIIISDSDFNASETESDFLDKKILWKIKIDNFRPPVISHGKKILYLNTKYKTILDRFIDAETERQLINEQDFGKDKTAFEQFLKGCILRMESRRDYLENRIHLNMEHWRCGYHYVSFPEVKTLFFNQSLTKVKLFFRYTWCSGGNAGFDISGDTLCNFSFNSTTWVE